MRRTPGVLSLAMAGLLTAACGSSSARPPVVVTVAQSRTIAAHPGGSGQFAAGVDVPVTLGYRGTVTHVDVSLGQRVTAGQSLLGISSDELSRSVAELTVRLQSDTANLALQQAAVPATGSVQGPTAAAALQSKLAAARARVALDQRLLDIARGRADSLRAPVTGVVASLSAQPNMAVTGSTKLVEIVDATTVTVDVHLPVAYQGQVQAGARVELRGVGVAGDPLLGTVTGISPQTVADGQTFVVSTRADNPGGRILPGMPAYARFDVTRTVPVAVNRLAIRNQGEQPSVLVVLGDKVQLRNVVLGVTDPDEVEVVTGLAAGDKVVLTGAQNLQDGQRVTLDAAGRSQ